MERIERITLHSPVELIIKNITEKCPCHIETKQHDEGDSITIIQPTFADCGPDKNLVIKFSELILEEISDLGLTNKILVGVFSRQGPLDQGLNEVTENNIYLIRLKSLF